MISDQEIEAKAAEFKVGPIEVEKDYVHGWLLKEIFTRPALRQELVLKGGNGLRKCYLPETRLSKDLDFSAHAALTPEFIGSELSAVCKAVEAATKVQFVREVMVKDKRLDNIPDVKAVEARVYFKGFYGEQTFDLKAQLDITQFDKIYLPIQERQIIHPYSDSAACAATIRCQKLEEILASKLTTLLHRRKPVDLFDLLYSIIFRDTFGVMRREVITTFLKKSIFEPNPISAKNELLATPLEEFRGVWGDIVAPVGSLFSFDFVIGNFAGLVESLFALAVPASGPATRVAGGGGLRGGRFGGTPAFSPAGPVYFLHGVRNTIISAGRSRTMIEMVYDGYRRIVEPYKLEYRIRKSDGRGAEYFWGFDRSGGKSGKVGIKQFFSDEIQQARPTGDSFTPRYRVEF